MAGSGSGLAYGKIVIQTYDIRHDCVSTNTLTAIIREPTERRFFRFPAADGTMKEVIRENKIGYSRLQQNNLGISFRAIYGTDKMSISNILSLDATNRPRLNSNGTVTFTPKIYQTSDYISTSSSNVIYPTWTGNFYLTSAGISS